MAAAVVMTETTIWGGGREAFPRPSGQEIFDSMTREQQDAEFGPEKAEALRKGTITLADLVAEAPTPADAPNFIREKPLANAKKE